MSEINEPAARSEQIPPGPFRRFRRLIGSAEVPASGPEQVSTMDQVTHWMRPGAGALFAGLDREQADALLDAASHRLFAEGATLFHQGDAPAQLFQVNYGLVKLSRVNPEGGQTTLRFTGPGDLVGCVAVFQQFPFPATATALKPTSVLCWGAGQIFDLLSRYPAVANNALRTVGDRAGKWSTGCRT
ncbi:Crp/Fnr family transcriptional regulator [Methylobacterium durans]|uniref:Crp/Fnr family transcriptional regulator n=1 Tax=Methylobacterium durans TaxID=2202825 RepID=UPI001F1F4F20|nr:cyclic nucleotide-binding domain-containing protein [Methylobacterium durans]